MAAVSCSTSVVSLGIMCVLQVLFVSCQYAPSRSQNLNSGTNSNQQQYPGSNAAVQQSGYGQFNAVRQQQQQEQMSPYGSSAILGFEGQNTQGFSGSQAVIRPYGQQQQQQSGNGLSGSGYGSTAQSGGMQQGLSGYGSSQTQNGGMQQGLSGSSGYGSSSQNGGMQQGLGGSNGFGLSAQNGGYQQQGLGGLSANGGNGASSGRGKDNGNPLNKLNLNYLGPRPDYCKRPTGQFAIANDCTSFYNCHENIAWIQKCPEGLGFNEAIYACDYAEAVGCAAAAAAASAALNSVQNSYGKPSSNNYAVSGNTGYGGPSQLQAQQQQQSMYNGGNAPFGQLQAQPQPQQQNIYNGGSGPSGLSSGGYGESAPSNYPGGYASGSSGVPSNMYPSNSLQQSATPGYLPQNTFTNPPPAVVLSNSNPALTPNNVENSWPANVVPPLSPCVSQGSSGRGNGSPQIGSGVDGGNTLDYNPASGSPAGMDYAGLAQTAGQSPSSPTGYGTSGQQPGYAKQGGFAVMEAQRQGQPGQSQRGALGMNLETEEGLSENGNEYSTIYGPNGPSMARAQCQPCSQPGAVCPAYNTARCFDDVCGGCRARFFIRKAGGVNPFVEVTSMCAGNGSETPLQDSAGRNQPY